MSNLEMSVENAYHYAYDEDMRDTHVALEFRVKGGRRWYDAIWSIHGQYSLTLAPSEKRNRVIRSISSDTIVEIRGKKP